MFLSLGNVFSAKPNTLRMYVWTHVQWVFIKCQNIITLKLKIELNSNSGCIHGLIWHDFVVNNKLYK